VQFRSADNLIFFRRVAVDQFVERLLDMNRRAVAIAS
jgi:hypothetical protein